MFEWKKLSVLVGLVVISLVAACGQERAERIPPSYEDIAVPQLREMMASGDLFLVNVHIPFEGDIPGTDQSIRFDEISEHLDQLPGDRQAKIILYCRSGRMSAEAAGTLASLGYTSVFNLVGGFREWEAAGFDLEQCY